MGEIPNRIKGINILEFFTKEALFLHLLCNEPRNYQARIKYIYFKLYYYFTILKIHPFSKNYKASVTSAKMSD